MENKQLEKSLGVAAALSTVVGMVIGGGVFFKPQAVYTLTGGAPGLGMLAMGFSRYSNNSCWTYCSRSFSCNT